MQTQEIKDQLAILQPHLTRGREDIVYFAWYFLGITLHPGQMRILRNADGMVNVIVSGNRFGKTVMIAVRHIWYSFYKIGWAASEGRAWEKIGYRTAALAPDSKILMVDYNVIMDIMRGRFVISKKGEPVTTNICRINWYLLEDQCRVNPTPLIFFRDNSGIKFYSTSNDKGTSIQGDFFGYCSYDEGGRSYWLELEIQQNIGPRLSELQAPLDLVSTPAQDSPSLAYHFDIFEKGLRGEDGFKSFEGSAYENLYLPKHYFEREEKRLKGLPLRDQVLEGKFVFAGASIFPKDDIEFAKDEGLNGGKRFQDGHEYIVGVDTAMGEDEMIFTVLDVTTDDFEVARQTGGKGNSKGPELWMNDFIDLIDSYTDPKRRNVHIILETYNGESARFYQDLPSNLQNITKCYGSWQPIGVKQLGRNLKTVRKAEIIIALLKVLAKRQLRLPNESTLIKQLSIYREEDANIPTDRVISLALACWLATDGKPKVTKIEELEVEF